MGVYRRWVAKLKRRRRAEAEAKQYLHRARARVKDATAERKVAEKVVKRHRAVSGRKKAIKWALSQVGTTESPPNSNDGPKISKWQAAVDMGAGPWCGAFVHAALRAGGVKGLSWRMRYVPYIVEDARLGRNGLVKVVPWHERMPGDLVCFQFDTGDEDHVGMYLGDLPDGQIRTVEGNTSSGNNGPQANGGGVFVRSRTRAQVAALCRPKYS